MKGGMMESRSRCATDLREFESCYYRVQVNNAKRRGFVPLFSRSKEISRGQGQIHGEPRIRRQFGAFFKTGTEEQEIALD
jgi:hypothetical protein